MVEDLGCGLNNFNHRHGFQQLTGQTQPMVEDLGCGLNNFNHRQGFQPLTGQTQPMVANLGCGLWSKPKQIAHKFPARLGAFCFLRGK